MKTILFPLLALTLLASCSKNESTDSPEAPVAIRLGSGVSISTKAPIVNGSEVEAGIAGWEVKSSASVDYATTPTWSDGQIKTTAGDATGQAVTWENNTQKYWHADENTTTYLKAWYPRGTVDVSVPATPKVTFENTDGSVDPLLAAVISGTKNDKENKNLAFVHKTAQLNFVVKQGTGLEAGTTLTSIKVNGVALPTGFDLTKAHNADDAVIYAAAGALTVPGISNVAIDDASTGKVAGNSVMIKPLDLKTFTIDVVTNKATYISQTVSVTDATVLEGSSYTITLTFTQTGISLQAKVTPWNESTGTGSIM